jgi:hypothetical protein
MEFLFIWAIFGLISALIANGRGGNGCAWFLLGMLLGPLAIIFVLFATGKKCPKCQSRIHEKAVRCSKCGTDL